MIHDIIHLNQFYHLKGDPILEYFYILDNDVKPNFKPGLLILPGGGYQFVSNRENDPIAISFLLKGYTCFSLKYITFGDGFDKPLYPEPQLDVLAAMDYIIKNASKYFVDVNKIGIMGFSAGGHLAASYSYLYNDEELLSILNLSNNDLYRPKVMCLAYPVITFKKYTHLGSMINLVDSNEELIEKLSVESHITSTYPKTFVWHAKPDDCVPFENSILLTKALEKAGVDYELFAFDNGFHGMSLATSLVCDKTYDEASQWVDKCDDFFKKICNL